MHELQLTETVAPGDAGPGTPELAPGELLAGRYEIRSVLGRGGSAVVYRAHDRELGREVAVKVLRPDRLSPASLLRLRREVNVARETASDRLVRVFDIGTSEGAVFLTMEIVEGGPLDRRLERGPLPIDEAVRITSQILEGLAVLHARSIVHRDVKPGNVLLTPEGDVKLGDFGIALLLASDETRATQHDAVLGTLQYLSPEQVLGQEMDARSDLYSLGVVLFEMLTGKLPYEGRSALGSILGHLREAPNVRTVRPQVPRWLAAVLARLLARRPDDRYLSAEAVLKALATRMAPHGLSRRRLLVGAVAAGLLLAGVVAVVLSTRPAETRFSYFKFSEVDQTATAIDTKGKPLWTAPKAFQSNLISARLAPTKPPRVVGVLDAFQQQETAVTLSILDADSGKSVETLALPNAADRFIGFSNTFHPRLYSVDLDRDGGEEIVAVYTHWPWWPTFAVLYEPRIDRKRLIFMASGHHQLSGAHDLDGDGRDELVFAGVNNRMGWYSGIAAVRLNPVVNDVSSWSGPAACTPDATYAGCAPELLLWYSLGPREHRYQSVVANFVPRQRRIRCLFPSGPFVLGFNGFPPDLPFAGKDREVFRSQTYSHLREINRLVGLGSHGDALAEVSAARDAVARVADPRLSDWVTRVHARTLVAAQRFDEAQAAYETLVRSSPAATDAAFEAGKALHLAGRLEQAVTWYLRGFGRGGAHGTGRGRSEILEGAVLALSELGRYKQAQREIDAFVAGYGMEAQMRILRRFLRWQEGTLEAGEEIPSDLVEDLHCYWGLELKLKNGLAARPLLSQVDQALTLGSEADPMLLSLKAELLARIGHAKEAASVAEEAITLAKVQRRDLTGVCAHFELIAQRAARFTRAVGNESRAREIEAELAAWLKTRRS